MLRGEAPVIRSDGKSIRDYFYVEDGAAAYMLLAEALAKRRELSGQSFNFSNELQMTVLDLVGRILAHLHSDLRPVIQNTAPHEIRHQYLSAKKARDMLGWKPLFDLDQGLKQTIEWYRHSLADAKKSQGTP